MRTLLFFIFVSLNVLAASEFTLGPFHARGFGLLMAALYLLWGP
jgi:hypothetical protein